MEKNYPLFLFPNEKKMLHWAYHGNTKETHLLLIDKKIDIHYEDDLAFRSACAKGNLEAVKYLLLNKELPEHADIHALNGQGFINACENGHMHVIDFLLTSTELTEYSDISCGKNSGLRIACENGHIETVKYLTSSPKLSKHANIYDTDWNVKNSLIIAANNNHFNIVEFLLYDLNMQISDKTNKHIQTDITDKDISIRIKDMISKRDLFVKLNDKLKNGDTLQPKIKI